MYACVFNFFLLLTHMLRCRCVIVDKQSDTLENISESKIEMAPLLVSAKLNDTIVLSAPIVNKGAIYYLSKPNGDIKKLQLNTSLVMTNFKERSRNDDKRKNMTIDNIKGTLKGIISRRNNDLNNINSCFESNNYYKERDKHLMPNDFVIGPVSEDDHGNWVLSVHFSDFIEKPIEFFQIISIEINESVPAEPAKSKLKIGKNFEVRFSQRIKDLQSCEIVAPRSTYDRFYDRDRAYLDFCGYRIPNVTKEDEGEWRIVGVGKIVYTANVYLETK